MSFVATDNKAAGRLAGEHIGKPLGEKGNVVVLRYQEGSASTQHREKGFLDAVTSDARHQGREREPVWRRYHGDGVPQGESLLLAQKAAEGGVAGVFTPNESTTFGMLQALQQGERRRGR